MSNTRNKEVARLKDSADLLLYKKIEKLESAFGILGNKIPEIQDDISEIKSIEVKDGYTPVKDVDYSDGYTPIKGVDYFDGEDGYTPVKGKDYFDGYTPIKGQDYFDGQDYILSNEDKEEIASMVDIPENELYSILDLEDTPDDYKDGHILISRKDSFEYLSIDKLQGNQLLGSGSSSFRGLSDTPKSYTGQALQSVRVKSDETGLEYYTPTDLNDAVKISVNDTTAGFLNGKLVAGSNITFTENNDGGNETLSIEAEIPPSIIIDTRANILAQTPENGTEGFSTDFDKKYLYYNGWYEQSAIYEERAGSVDIGVVQDSNISGYGRDYVSDKHLANVTLGEYNKTATENAIRITTIEGTKFVQAYINGEWKTILSGINIEVDDVEPDVELTDFDPYRISLITGNSDVTGLNGLPIVQNMQVDMGAYPTNLVINGGTF